MKKIHHLEKAIKEAEQSVLDMGQISDMFDAQRMLTVGNRDMYAGQLKREMDLLETLHKVDLSIIHKRAEFGSIVITEKENVFISIGLGKTKLENDDYYAISTKVPFFDAMKNREEGDVFTFRGQEIRILEIY
ncbi:MAG: hypothetical protein K8S16_03250 [Bacteroidales bacterium]|nr:hypothetical protein [Bacteroidales bacterium]